MGVIGKEGVYLRDLTEEVPEDLSCLVRSVTSHVSTEENHERVKGSTTRPLRFQTKDNTDTTKESDVDSYPKETRLPVPSTQRGKHCYTHTTSVHPSLPKTVLKQEGVQ